MMLSQTDINCGETLRITHVAAIYSQLASAVAQGARIRINISDLNQVDTAGLQLLYGFQRDAAMRGIELHWSTPTSALRDATRILGLPAFYQ